MRVVGLLKTLKRTGWVNHGVTLPESVADHMYRMSVIAMLLVDSRLNKDRLVKSEYMSCYRYSYLDSFAALVVSVPYA